MAVVHFVACIRMGGGLETAPWLSRLRVLASHDFQPVIGEDIEDIKVKRRVLGQGRRSVREAESSPN